MSKSVAVIGGGAAGFFAAINIAENNPDLKLCIYEGSNKLLSKVLISGGGRCNVTNAESSASALAMQYPRGHEFLVPVFQQFGTKETGEWFTMHGVKLKTEADGRVFPVSNSSQTIYDCFLDYSEKLGIKIELNHRLSSLERGSNKWEMGFKQGVEAADFVILASGGNSGIWEMLNRMGYRIVPPCPSLFTFRCTESGFNALSGISVPDAELSTDFELQQQTGPFLITHRGFSGPAVLKLSAWGARILKDKDYKFKLKINWIGEKNRHFISGQLDQMLNRASSERIVNWKDHGLPKRLYLYLVDRAGIQEYTNWAELGKKKLQALKEQLLNCKVEISGKDTFKEEFVTAGGIAIEEVDLKTFQSKKDPQLYFAGEILDIDALTGGFNFQAAWSTAYLISRAVRLK